MQRSSSREDRLCMLTRQRHRNCCTTPPRSCSFSQDSDTARARSLIPCMPRARTGSTRRPRILRGSRMPRCGCLGDQAVFPSQPARRKWREQGPSTARCDQFIRQIPDKATGVLRGWPAPIAPRATAGGAAPGGEYVCRQPGARALSRPNSEQSALSLMKSLA